MPHGPSIILHLVFVCLYAQEFKTLINNTNCMPMNFQCKHSDNYDDVLFHIFADHLMPTPGGGADPEHNMSQALIFFIKENTEKVKLIAEPYLKKKK